jgi:hypothetical protein
MTAVKRRVKVKIQRKRCKCGRLIKTRAQKCPQCNKASVAKWRKEHPEVIYASNLKRYGITLADYDQMLKRQKGVCAICKKPETHSRQRRLSVDHNHETGEVRGLLCARCNRALGMFNDNPDLLRSAARYLRVM